MTENKPTNKLTEYVKTKTEITLSSIGEIYKFFPKGIPTGISVRMNKNFIESIIKKYPQFKSFSDIVRYSIVKQFPEKVKELIEYSEIENSLKYMENNNRVSDLIFRIQKKIGRDLIYPDFSLNKKLKNMPVEDRNKVLLPLAIRKKIAEDSLIKLYEFSKRIGISEQDFTNQEIECTKCKKKSQYNLMFFDWNGLQKLCPFCYAENYAGTNIDVGIVPNCPCNQNVQTSITMKNRLEFVLNHLDKNRLYHIKCFKEFAEKKKEDNKNG